VDRLTNQLKSVKASAHNRKGSPWAEKGGEVDSARDLERSIRPRRGTGIEKRESRGTGGRRATECESSEAETYSLAPAASQRRKCTVSEGTLGPKNVDRGFCLDPEIRGGNQLLIKSSRRGKNGTNSEPAFEEKGVQGEFGN